MMIKDDKMIIYLIIKTKEDYKIINKFYFIICMKNFNIYIKLSKNFNTKRVSNLLNNNELL